MSSSRDFSEILRRGNPHSQERRVKEIPICRPDKEVTTEERCKCVGSYDTLLPNSRPDQKHSQFLSGQVNRAHGQVCIAIRTKVIMSMHDPVPLEEKYELDTCL